MVARTGVLGRSASASYDPLDRLSTVADWLVHTTRFGYDNVGNLTAETYPNTTTATVSYDNANRPTKIVDSQGATPLWTYTYGWDKAGQLSASSDPLDGKAHSYGYDPLDQLTSDQQSGGGITSTNGWGYNAAHDLTAITNTVQGTTSALGYDKADELTSLVTTAGKKATQNLMLGYNADGDRTSQSDSVGGASASYGYDQTERLITATVGLTRASYLYDGDGLRQSKTVSGTATAHTWDVADGLPARTLCVDDPEGNEVELICRQIAVQRPILTMSRSIACAVPSGVSLSTAT